MHVKLKILRGGSAGKEVAIKGPHFFIGRTEQCHLRANSDAISRRHCAITVDQDGTVKVRDLGSRNGTYVNGHRIDGEHLVQVGDQLRVGPLEFLVTFLKSAAAATKTPPKPSGNKPDDDMAGLIDGWLSESEDSALAEQSSSETREFRIDETNRIHVPEPANGKKQTAPGAADAEKSETSAESESGVEQAASDDGAKPAQERAPVLPTGRRSSAKQAPKDTQEAAAQTLRKFFNRGG